MSTPPKKSKLGWCANTLLLFTFATSLCADDIKLTDGRVFKDAHIVSQSPSTVTIRYANGISSVAKTLLPIELLARYPLDPKIAADARAKAAAVANLREPAKAGDPVAQYQLGAAYLKGDGVEKDFVEAVFWFRQSAEKGNADAQRSLGNRYLRGEGVPKDSAEAARWLSKSAEQGHAEAQCLLGDLYLNGDGVSKDPLQAVKWLTKSAEQGWVAAQILLGVCYYRGNGVLVSSVEALAWFNVSAASGDDTGKNLRDTIEDGMSVTSIVLARQRSQAILDRISAVKERRAAATPSSLPATAPAEASAAKFSGSGAIVSTSGHVVTAAHVVTKASKLTVMTSLGARNARVLRVDEANDIAILKVDGGNFEPLPIAQSRRVRLGQSVATIGFPSIDVQGFSPKVTRGEISSLNGISDDPREWQISVPVQPGNSGGPLLDENGNLIGIVVSRLVSTSTTRRSDAPQNVNYAVKSTYALALLEPYLDSDTATQSARSQPLRFEDMVAKAQQSVVLILGF